MPTAPPDTTPDALDASLATLSDHAAEWARLPVPAKVALLDDLRARVASVAARWVEAASDAKGLAPGAAARGEEWAAGPWALLNLLGPLAATLNAVHAGALGALVAGRVRTGPGGQAVVRAVPSGLSDNVLLSGYALDVWMQPSVEPTEAGVAATLAPFYREAAPSGGVAAVLGAGNVAAIPALDVLYELYAHGRVVLLKLNPVNAYLGPILEDAFRPFVDRGYLRLAYGGADVGERLTRHAAVDAIHVTGSAATHDAIVYGTGPEGEARKARDEPAIATPVTSELGGVGAVVVVPGDWSEADLRFQAEHVATMKRNNAGFNCIAAQVLVLPADWPQREAFLDELRSVLRELPDRPAYYPGADARQAALRDAHPEHAERAGQVALLHVAPDAGGAAFTEEAFGSTLAVTALPGGGPAEDPADWLDRAVAFANDRLAGTLGVQLLVHPRTLRRLGGQAGGRLEAAIARLRYGTVGVNVWSGAGFLFAQAAWGAYPGHERADIQSGRGVVHNALLFSRTEKNVAWGPFAPFPRSVLLGERHAAPKPPWFVTHEASEATVRGLTELTAAPSAGGYARVIAAAFRG